MVNKRRTDKHAKLDDNLHACFVRRYAQSHLGANGVLEGHGLGINNVSHEALLLREHVLDVGLAGGHHLVGFKSGFYSGDLGVLNGVVLPGWVQKESSLDRRGYWHINADNNYLRMASPFSSIMAPKASPPREYAEPTKSMKQQKSWVSSVIMYTLKKRDVSLNRQECNEMVPYIKLDSRNGHSYANWHSTVPVAKRLNEEVSLFWGFFYGLLFVTENGSCYM
jgi:hypothetical protein